MTDLWFEEASRTLVLVDCAGLTGAVIASHAALIKGLMRRTAEDVIEIDGRSALHGIRRTLHRLIAMSPGVSVAPSEAAERCTAAVAWIGPG